MLFLHDIIAILFIYTPCNNSIVAFLRLAHIFSLSFLRYSRSINLHCRPSFIFSHSSILSVCHTDSGFPLSFRYTLKLFLFSFLLLLSFCFPRSLFILYSFSLLLPLIFCLTFFLSDLPLSLCLSYTVTVSFFLSVCHLLSH